MSWWRTGVVAGRAVVAGALVLTAAVVDGWPAGDVVSSALSSPHAASRADAAVSETPIIPNRRSASRRVSWPSAWSSATSVARCSWT